MAGIDLPNKISGLACACLHIICGHGDMPAFAAMPAATGRGHRGVYPTYIHTNTQIRKIEC